MCLFTYNNKSAIKARLAGIEKFECGSCPECLQKKSRKWALRCGMEAQTNVGVMVTLTYDSYKLDKNGVPLNAENPVDPTIPLNKTHCQKFIKRLRRYFEYHFGITNIKYLLTAERGKTTHRAHYHALLFGVSFDDLVFYKKSKRGNIIYKSKTLEKIWSHGISTVDCVNLTAKTARYCTKYCAKDGGIDDTFMLFSRGIGRAQLLKKFNGKSYWIEGREYPIPRDIWQYYIEHKYNIIGYSRYKADYKLYDLERITCSKLDKLEKYLEQNPDDLFTSINQYDNIKKQFEFKWFNNGVASYRQKIRRDIYSNYRDNDSVYKCYLSYWKKKSKIYDLSRPTEFQRLLALDSNKYRAYKALSVNAKIRQLKKFDFIPPRSNCHGFCKFYHKDIPLDKSFAPLSRHYRANDTNAYTIISEWCLQQRYLQAESKFFTLTPWEISPF